MKVIVTKNGLGRRSSTQVEASAVHLVVSALVVGVSVATAAALVKRYSAVTQQLQEVFEHSRVRDEWDEIKRDLSTVSNRTDRPEFVFAPDQDKNPF